VGLPPDRAPRDDDWAWLNALAGHPEPDTEKRVLRETKLLAEALKDAMAGMEPPREDLQTRFEVSSSLSAKDFDESSKMGVIASIDPLFSSTERIRPSASFSKASRTYSDDDGIYPEPTGNGFAALKRRLQDAGLL
jgi:hypothetical protein